MKDIVWDNILSIGVDEIDEDHRKLIHIFNILNHAVAEKESPEYLAACLDELIYCTVWHFSHEERLMLKFRYPEAEAHKTEHRDLIQSAKGGWASTSARRCKSRGSPSRRLHNP